MLLTKKQSFIDYSEKNHRFLYSDYYLLLLVLIGSIAFIYELERYALGLFILMVSYNLVVTKDMMPNFGLFVFIALVPLGRYAQDGYFYPLLWIAPVIVGAVIAHFILYPPKVKAKTFLYPTIVVAIAISLGGLFSPNFVEGFKMPALYYIIVLGFGMVGIYLLYESYIDKDNPDTIDYFARIMVALGVMGIIMITVRYAQYWRLFEDLNAANRFTIGRSFQFRNNLSNNLLISMPFSFYLALKGKRAIFYFTIGCLQYVVMMMSLSRGGMLFSTMVIPFLILFTLILNKNKKDRNKMLIVLAIFIVVGVTFILFPFRSVLDYLLNRITVSPNEARANLYKLAWENFLNFPIFGRGLGYDGGVFYNPQVWCIYWYHSTLFQILGSLGIVGVLAYGYQYFVRFKELLKSKNTFNLFVLLSFAGFEGYSLVNVGNFAPLPFVMMIIVMFIITDRYNGINKSQPEVYIEERIFKEDRNKVIKARDENGSVIDIDN